MCHSHVCVHVFGVVHYNAANECFASESQAVYCYSDILQHCSFVQMSLHVCSAVIKFIPNTWCDSVPSESVQ